MGVPTFWWCCPGLSPSRHGHTCWQGHRIACAGWWLWSWASGSWAPEGSWQILHSCAAGPSQRRKAGRITQPLLFSSFTWHVCCLRGCAELEGMPDRRSLGRAGLPRPAPNTWPPQRGSGPVQNWRSSLALRRDLGIRVDSVSSNRIISGLPKVSPRSS